MIIISDLRGQLCNRIFLTAYGLSLQAQTGQAFLDFSLDKYAKLFPKTRRPAWAVMPYKVARYAVRLAMKIGWASRIGRFLFIDVTYENSGEVSPGNPDFIARLNRRTLTFLRVDQYFDLSKLKFPNVEIIRQRFQPDPEIRQGVLDHVGRAKGDAEVLVGIHIRRSDYDVHLGGRHFYPLELYLQAMERMVALLPDRKVAFLVCSDEAVPDDFLAPYRATRGPGSLLGDLYGLAECDYLIGPPSTFSLWAAYYGRKQLYQMTRPELPQNLDQFMIPDGHFECYDLSNV